jgi:nucleotide-binding universal stress UspA family protein
MVKVLLPVDGSRHALAATRRLIHDADWFKDPIDVELVTVQGRMPRVSGLSRAVLSQAAIARHYREQGEKALASSKRLLSKAGIHHAEHILVGDVAPTLVKHAASKGCDMIYMGTRGLTATSGLLLGSVATRVLHLARVPVVLVK